MQPLDEVAIAGDFCSFHGKRILFAILIGSALGTVQKAHAFSCDEFNATILTITAEDKVINAQHQAVGNSDADQCRFNRKTYVPYVTKTKQSVIQFVNCPKSGTVATALAGEYEKALKVLMPVDAHNAEQSIKRMTVTFIHQSPFRHSQLWQNQKFRVSLSIGNILDGLYSALDHCFCLPFPPGA